MKKYDKEASQNGAIIVEAAFIFPLIIIVIFILLYMAFFQIQQSIMYTQAQNMAQKIANIVTFPGFEELYENSNEPSSTLLNTVYSKHDPYRYLIGINGKKYDSYERELREITENSSFLNGGTPKAYIDINFKNLSYVVTVKLTYDFNMPRFVKILGLNPNICINAEAVTYLNDSVDFIRNSDLAFDLIDYLLQKYNLKDDIDTFYNKIKKVTEKLF